jgi:hypothetical protein
LIAFGANSHLIVVQLPVQPEELNQDEPRDAVTILSLLREISD